VSRALSDDDYCLFVFFFIEHDLLPPFGKYATLFPSFPAVGKASINRTLLPSH
jgi:hypothetical protein